MRVIQRFTHAILQIKVSSPRPTTSPSLTSPLPFGPFNSATQRRWRKRPADTARTRLEGRTRDLKLDKHLAGISQLNLALTLHRLMSARKRGPFVSLQLMCRWKNIVGLNIAVGDFIRKYPHVFEVFTHRLRRNVCCRLSKKMRDLIEEEQAVIRNSELENVVRLKKLLTMSINGTLHVHALRLIRRELGLPEDFRESILGKYNKDFRLVDLEIVALVDRDEEFGVAHVENWRENEFKEKWLSEFETQYAFPITFPTGFKIVAGFREKLKNWQRLPYVKPYERKGATKIRTCGGVERFEKRVVGILHEFLCLTVEKRVEVERLVHFRKDFGMEVNMRELILKHPGIFYISTKGNAQTVFLREAYDKGCLIEPNAVHVVRRKMLELIFLGRRNTRELRIQKEMKYESKDAACNNSKVGTRDGDWVVPILDSFDDLKSTNEPSEVCGVSE
ncbi:hypothetical protein NMG60_11028086 [Bertholletia excelsa]